MKIIKLILRKIKRLANKIFGTKTDEFYWKFRHIFDKGWAENYISEKSINNPHRKFLIERILNYFPFENVLEIGCASCPNLYLLAKRFSEAKFYGIDISKKAIETGRGFFKKENIKNVFLEVGEAEKLNKFSDKSIDIIFTDAALIYLGTDKINLAIKEMLRVAKKAIILHEQHNELPSSAYKDLWIHNYKNLFGKFIPEEKIKIDKISEKLLKDGWGELDYIIEIKL